MPIFRESAIIFFTLYNIYTMEATNMIGKTRKKMI